MDYLPFADAHSEVKLVLAHLGNSGDMRPGEGGGASAIPRLAHAAGNARADLIQLPLPALLVLVGLAVLLPLTLLQNHHASQVILPTSFAPSPPAATATSTSTLPPPHPSPRASSSARRVVCALWSFGWALNVFGTGVRDLWSGTRWSRWAPTGSYSGPTREHCRDFGLVLRFHQKN